MSNSVESKGSPSPDLHHIRVELIDEPGNVLRLEIVPEKVESLARNIEQVGLLQPIVLRLKGDRYEIVAGHHRYKAFLLMGRKTIPSFVREMDDVTCALARGSENLARVDLSPIEEAYVYHNLVEVHGLTYEQIGREMGRSPGVVKRRLKLLSMPDNVQKAIHEGSISYGVGEELVRLESKESVGYYLSYAIDHGITVAVAREWVKEELGRIRRGGSDIDGGGGGGFSEPQKPIYVSCDLCDGPMVLGEETVIRCCPGCAKELKNVSS